jgi:hypothetical protein
VKVHVKVIPCRDKKTDRKKERMRERDMLERNTSDERGKDRKRRGR